MDDEPPGGGGGACGLRTAANVPADPVHRGGNADSVLNPAALIGSSCCQRCHRSTPRTMLPSRSQRTSPGPRLRPPADVVGQMERGALPLLRLPQEGKAASEGAAAPWGPRPPGV
jgi:hypothetical protein